MKYFIIAFMISMFLYLLIVTTYHVGKIKGYRDCTEDVSRELKEVFK